MFSKISNYWNEYGFNILLIASIAFIFFYWLFFRRNKVGTYSTKFFWPNDIPKSSKSPNKRRPPTNSKGEIKCKLVVERLFGKSFTKTRPKFMFNSVTSENLELDMFNEELMLAVEYNGRQHYEYTPFFHKSKDAFYGQKYRDRMKREICKKLGINLIEVPYTVKLEDIDYYLRNEIKNRGYKI